TNDGPQRRHWGHRLRIVPCGAGRRMPLLCARRVSRIGERVVDSMYRPPASPERLGRLEAAPRAAIPTFDADDAPDRACPNAHGPRPRWWHRLLRALPARRWRWAPQRVAPPGQLLRRWRPAASPRPASPAP